MTNTNTNITDCGMPTTSPFCREHNVKFCNVCIKKAGRCDHGGCHKRAEKRVYVTATKTDKVVETRPLCTRHADDFASRTDGGRWSFEIRAL